ncbi:MAG: hypothetical protein WBX23_12065 [Candidatus Cybelea sp.]
MATLGKEADRRGYSMRAVAQQIGVDLRVFQRYFSVKTPRRETLEAVLRGLNKLSPRYGTKYPSIVARALFGRFTVGQLQDELAVIVGEIGIHGSRIFGRNAIAASLAFRSATQGNEQKNARVRACRASILARYGLRSETHPILGSHLGSVESALVRSGFSLLPFVDNQEAIIERKRRGISWFLLLNQTLGLSAEDQAKIGRVMEPYIAGAPFDVAQLELDDAARDAAVAAYEQVVQGSTPPTAKRPAHAEAAKAKG